jgi:sugar-specific transcriptional regulator TrmB
MYESATSIAERLTNLGFSRYEARTYVGLLMSEGATGYGVANDTGVPQPKVYETLRRLVDRGAAILTGEKPARYTAVSPNVLLGALERDFGARVEAARQSLKTLPERTVREGGVALSRLDSFAAATKKAVRAIGRANSRVYLSGRTDELKGLADAVDEASGRGVRFVIVHFGRLPFQPPRGQVMRHSSTEGILYASRKARHLAVVADSKWALWALARDGREWEVVYGEVPLVASLVKSYIRHDLFVQKMYADLPNELEGLYGPGLLQLTNLSEGDLGAEAAPGSAAASESL